MFDEELLAKKKHLLEDLNTNGEKRYFLLAEYNENIIATISYGPSSDLINSCTQNATEHILEMGSVFILPQYPKMGIVDLLIKKLLLKLKEANIDSICFDSGYPVAQEVWNKKMGVPQYIMENHWGQNLHHMIWIINIDMTLARLK